ncbi:hypothetical protein JW916_08310 [Candidatus Sumerlaeota bacterium]|nr:hypothetical protein [Candidatus Sumerlaeota bacterium]
MRVLLFLVVCMSVCASVSGQIVVDHECTNLSAIPSSAIENAKAQLHVAYEHTSHGSQIITGMTGLEGFAGSLFDWNNGPSTGALDIDDRFSGGTDLGNSDWPNLTRTYLDTPANSDVNVIIWSWCGQVSWATESDINTYLSAMTTLESEYPGVQFVYMTGHLDGTGLTGNLHIRNQQIRDYCNTNNKVLFDFADIETYDPGGVYYGDKHPTDGCNYDYDGNGTTEQSGDPAVPTGGDRNWAMDWQDAHTEGVDWFDCSPAHTQPLNGNLKAYAAWWLWARLAGWSGPSPGENAVQDRCWAIYE